MSRHYTDDGEMTACGEYLIEALPLGEELIRYPDDKVTCPVCKRLEQLVIQVSRFATPDDVQQESSA